MNEKIANFPLSWRWTQESHNILPELVLSRIAPLATEQIAEYTESTVSKIFLKCVHSSTCNSETRDWLNSLPNQEKEVTLVWDLDTAVSIPWTHFCEYWGDFCYTSSDDVDIFNSDKLLFLRWCHDGRFEYDPRAL